MENMGKNIADSEAIEEKQIDKLEENTYILNQDSRFQIDELKKKKQELKLEKIRLRKLGDEKRAFFEEQFNLACEKYKMILDYGKITKELYDERIKGMEQAIENEMAAIIKEMNDIDEESEKLASIIENMQKSNSSENVKQDEKVVAIPTKELFKELYKKLVKDSIAHEEFKRILLTLTDANSYDSFGITTGLVFNKAKKILKLAGAILYKRIVKYIDKYGSFSQDICFDSNIEKDNIISHTTLNSWKNIDEKLTYTDARFSIEKYIEKIEQFVKTENVLTEEQQCSLKEAIDLKSILTIFRKAVNVSEEVTTYRNDKRNNSVFYSIFKNKLNEDKTKALPETEAGLNVCNLVK